MSRLIPSYHSGYARSAAECAYPELWNGLRLLLSPALGVTGNTIHDIASQKHNISLGASATWGRNWINWGDSNGFVTHVQLAVSDTLIWGSLTDQGATGDSGICGSSDPALQLWLDEYSGYRRWAIQGAAVGYGSALVVGRAYGFCYRKTSDVYQVYVEGTKEIEVAAPGGGSTYMNALATSAVSTKKCNHQWGVFGIITGNASESAAVKLSRDPLALVRPRPHRVYSIPGGAASYYQLDWGHETSQNVGVGAGRFGTQVI